MGRRSTGTVEPLKTCIRLKFTVDGVRQSETLNLEPTAANINAAKRQLVKVQTAIDAGVYLHADFFESTGPRSLCSFKEYSERVFSCIVLEKSTRRSYRTAMMSTWYPEFGQKTLTSIRTSDIKYVIACRRKIVSAKTINNYLVPLRTIFSMAVSDGLIKKNPVESIRNLKHQVAGPDPFNSDEVQLLLNYMRDEYPSQVANYFEFAFQTGMRPSELIALRWSDIDWTGRRARVERAMVDWEMKGTKTHAARRVDLTATALEVLGRQKVYTSEKGADAEVFNNPSTGRPWADEQVQRRKFFNPALAALGLRRRDSYQTRHTYASLALMGGVNSAYIAKQLGHANLATTLKCYARWISDSDGGVEAAKLDAVLSR